MGATPNRAAGKCEMNIGKHRECPLKNLQQQREEDERNQPKGMALGPGGGTHFITAAGFGLYQKTQPGGGNIGKKEEGLTSGKEKIRPRHDYSLPQLQKGLSVDFTKVQFIADRLLR